MNGTQTHVATMQSSATETKSKTIAGSSIMEAFGALATIALAIVGLAGIWPAVLAAVATIVVGAAILMEGGVWGMKRSQMAGAYQRTEIQFSQGSVDADFLGGLAAVVLGILSLLGVASTVLLAVAVIAVGATLLLSGRLFIGLAGVVLGILAVVGLSAPVLILVGLLSFGAGLLIAGSEVATRTFTAQT
jgi:hypothetical protein